MSSDIVWQDDFCSNVYNGFRITVVDNGKNITDILVREGCDGSPNCALEIYAAKGHYLDEPGLNIHASDREMEMLYQALKAVRKARRNATR